MKQIKFKSEARNLLNTGITQLYDAVKTTLGPRGKNVIIVKDNSVAITKDGATVAREVQLDDPIIDAGSQIIKQIAHKVAMEAGDGTTTATILAANIFSEGKLMIESGAQPLDLKNGIDKATKQIITELKALSLPVDSIDTIRQVATISANNDSEIGNLIANSIGEVGFDGIITVGESKTSETFVDIVKGLQFNNGYISPYFINNVEKSTVELEKPIILLYDSKISNLNDILQYLDYSNKINRPLLIISDGVDGEALNTLIINKLKGTIKVAAVRSPGFGELKQQKLEDIAAIVGGQVISQIDGTTLRESIAKDNVGTCERVIITNDNTMIVGGGASEEVRHNRIAELKMLIEHAPNESQKIVHKERLAKFEGGVAIIKIGAISELEAREKADRIDDSLGATKSAISDGIIAGGGLPLANIANNLNMTFKNRDEELGYEIVKRACNKPFSIILENANLSPDVIWNKIEQYITTLDLDSATIDVKYRKGFDVKNLTYCDMIDNGIIDPVKVTITALENAVSIASLLLTTDCLMVQKSE